MQPTRLNKRIGQPKRSGTAATEFAITVPVLLLLAIASMDFGRIAYYAEVVSNATRAGAEAGATRQFTLDTRANWENHVHDAVKREMQSLPNFDESKLEWNVSTSNDSDGIVRVKVDLAYPFATVVTWPLMPSQVRLHDQVQFRQFR